MKLSHILLLTMIVLGCNRPDPIKQPFVGYYPFDEMKGKVKQVENRFYSCGSDSVETEQSLYNISVRKYNESGSLVENEVRYIDDPEDSYKSVYEYDDKNNIWLGKELNSEGNLLYETRSIETKDYKWFLEFDSIGIPKRLSVSVYTNGRESHYVTINSSREIIDEIWFVYDKKNNTRTHIWYTGNKFDSKIVSYMNKDEKDTLTNFYTETIEELNFIIRDGYNSNGDHTYTEFLNPDGSFDFGDVFRYEYDSHGNWIRRETCNTDDWGKTYKIEKRTIEYYE